MLSHWVFIITKNNCTHTTTILVKLWSSTTGYASKPWIETEHANFFSSSSPSQCSYLLKFTINKVKQKDGKLMQEMQENYYLIWFMFASQLYFYVLDPISLLGY